MIILITIVIIITLWVSGAAYILYTLIISFNSHSNLRIGIVITPSVQSLRCREGKSLTQN